MATDPTTLAAQIEERLTEGETTANAAILAGAGTWTQGISMFDSNVVRPEDASVAGDDLFIDRGGDNDIALGHAIHIARNDPARVLRRVAVTRELVAAILAEPHDWNPGDEFYSCSQAIDPYGLNHDDREPGSACTDPDRAGKPCDCGRDQRVARLLGIIASEWET